MNNSLYRSLELEMELHQLKGIKEEYKHVIGMFVSALPAHMGGTDIDQLKAQQKSDYSAWSTKKKEFKKELEEEAVAEMIQQGITAMTRVGGILRRSIQKAIIIIIIIIIIILRRSIQNAATPSERIYDRAHI